MANEQPGIPPTATSTSDANQNQGEPYNAEAMIPKLQWSAALGAFFIFLYALQFRPLKDGFRVAAIGIVIASAAMMFGVLFGFIFCIPRLVKRTDPPLVPLPAPVAVPPPTISTATPSSTTQLPPVATPSPNSNQFDDNSNLVDISDWLTKILVGAGLVELNKLPLKIWALAGALSNGLRVCDSASCIYSSQVFALAILFTYGPLGFMIGYLWTRLYYQPTLSNLRRNNTALRSKVTDLVQETKNLVQQNSFQSYLNTAITSREVNRLEDARDSIDQALEIEPEDGRALFEKARILRKIALSNNTTPDRSLLSDALAYVIQAEQRMPQKSAALYNAACYQNLLGYPISAVLANLRQAINLDTRLKQFALGDSDFASIQKEPDFLKLVMPDDVSAFDPNENAENTAPATQQESGLASPSSVSQSNPQIGDKPF